MHINGSALSYTRLVRPACCRLAMKSFKRAVLEADNETLVGKVTSVTPQQVHTSTKRRSCRVDIQTDTEENERIVTEIQINPDSRIMVRNLFSASQIFRESSVKGDSPTQMVKRMPKIIHINLLAYDVRENSNELLEPFKILYTKEPKEIAIPNFSGYNIQLPKIEKMAQNFDSALYCWCYAVYTAHVEGNSLKEVIDMSKALQDYALQDPGFAQFCERYNFVASDPESQREYVSWVNDVMREVGIKEAAWISGEKEGMKKGIKKGMKKGMEVVAVNMLKKNHSTQTVADLKNLPIMEVKALRDKFKIK